MHHGAKKSACKNTPPVKCATRKTSDKASIPAVLPGSGVLVMSPAGPVIDPRPPPALQMAASAARFVNSVGTPPREGTLKTNAITTLADPYPYARCHQPS